MKSNLPILSKLTLSIEGTRCSACFQNIEDYLLAQTHIPPFQLDVLGKTLSFEPTPTPEQIDSIKLGIAKLGYSLNGANTPFSIAEIKGEKQGVPLILILSLIGAAPFFLTMPWMIIGHHRVLSPFWEALFSTLVLASGGRVFLKGAYLALKAGYSNMDLLVAMGSFSAYFYSLVLFLVGDPRPAYFEASAMVISLVHLGKYLEERATIKTKGSIEILSEQFPPKANRINNENLEVTPLEEILTGDLLRVLPGEKIPMDGIIITGKSEVDESQFTGEPLPVFKKLDSKVFAGTQNLTGSFDFRVTHLLGETKLAEIVEFIKKARSEKAPIQKQVDKIARVFVPLILFLSFLTCLIWLFLGLPEQALHNTFALLVVACPCALGLATPTALITGIGMGADHGILFKGGEALEKASHIQGIFFDKTGTLTEGRPKIVKTILLAQKPKGKRGMEEEIETLTLAGSLEQKSEHPLARAFKEELKNRKLQPLRVNNFENKPGKGITGDIENDFYLMGNKNLLKSFSIPFPQQGEELESDEITTQICLVKNNLPVALFYLQDPIRKKAKEAIQKLQGDGLKIALLTGDRKKSAERVGEALMISDIFYEASPIDKGRILKEWQNQGLKMGMAGDGINDAGALALADFSISMGGGSDLAKDQSDLILTTNQIESLRSAFSLSKATLTKIKQNLFWAFFYNCLAIPLAAMGYLHPMIAGFAMALSSLSVVCNSLLLRLWKPIP